MKKDRYLYLDIAKGIAIISVVLGHIILKYDINNPVCIFLYSFHLPIFFIITGILFALNPKSIFMDKKKFALKKIKSLIYPYITFSIVTIIYLFIKGDSLTSIVKIGINTIFLFGYGPIWFLPTLLISEIMFYSFIKKDKKVKIISGVVIIVLMIILSNVLQLPFWQENIINEFIYKFLNLIGRSLIAVLFIIGGYYFQKNRNKIPNNIIIYICILLINIYISQINGLIDIHYCMINNFILFIYIAFSTSISILIILEKIAKKEKVLAFFGKNSLIVMSTHYTFPFINVAMLICQRLLETKNVLILSSLETLIVMILEYIIIEVINHKFEFMIKIKQK